MCPSSYLKQRVAQKQLAMVIRGGTYNENVVKGKVQKIKVHDGYILVKVSDGLNVKAYLK